MKLLFRRAFIVFLAAGLVGCSSFPGLGGLFGELNFSYTELSDRLAKRFPFERSLAGLLDVKLLHPRIGVAPDAKPSGAPRLSVTVDAEATLMLTKKSVYGSITMSGVPHYVPATRAIFLRDARIDSLNADGLPESLVAAVTKAASSIARDALEEKPIYTVDEKDLQRMGMSLNPTGIEVRRNGLALKLR